MKPPVLLPCPRSLQLLRGTLKLPDQQPLPPFTVLQSDSAPDHREGYAITIDRNGVKIEFRETAGLRAAMSQPCGNYCANTDGVCRV